MRTNVASSVLALVVGDAIGIGAGPGSYRCGVTFLCRNLSR
jgi:hypothetical protein